MKLTNPQMIRKCLAKKWMSDTQLFLEMRLDYCYKGSPCTLARQRREACAGGGIIERYRVNQQGDKYKQFKAEK
tara:strand:+ start:126 stop:347 length:222 start_codon:yes stop_codon:yes gene_type:complete